MRRAFYLSLLATILAALSAGYPAAAAAKSKKQKPDLTFTGVEALVFGVPCTADFTSKSVGTTLCSVYTGTVTGPALGKQWSAAVIDLTITRAAAGDTSPDACHGMYLNIQFSNGVKLQKMYGFGSVCGPDNSPENYQSGAKLNGNGGWAQIDSNGTGTGVGTFAATFTPERDAKGDNLVITFQKAQAAQ